MPNRSGGRAASPFVYSHSSGRCLLQICGSNKLLNELLGTRLVGSTESFCRKINEVGASRCSPRSRRRMVPCLRIDIIDAADFDLPRQWTEVSRRMARASEHVVVVFFNLPEDAPPGLEREALARGVRGMFYRSDSMDTLEKGMRAILSGDVWFRRELLYRAATGLLGTSAVEARAEMPAIITARERQFLHCLAQGVSNQEISDRLCVSLHTVKTHLYRIYRKIGVGNRHQAALWALEFGAAVPAATPLHAVRSTSSHSP